MDNTPGSIGKGETVWGGVVVELSGEFDISRARALCEALDDALNTGRPVVANLSGVTFLDVVCVRELAVRHQLCRDRLALCRPSPEAKLSVAACDLEGWLSFHPDEEADYRLVV